MATVRHVTVLAGRMKYQAAWFLLDKVYQTNLAHVFNYCYTDYLTFSLAESERYAL